MTENKKQKKWIRFRHRVVRNIAYVILYPYSRIKYRIHIEKFQEQKNTPYLILLNHQTPFDQFFVGMSFKGPIYYLATEDIFSMGWLSSLIRYLVAPIPIKKQTSDVKAVKQCIRVAREGGTICIAPEGNRTYSGRTEYMNDSIASLAKMLKLPIALYRIEGGYGAEPRWSDVVRKGKMRGYVSQVIEPDEYKNMSNEELFGIIEKGLYVDEAVADCEFHHKKRAEYLERAMYVCPFCGISRFESENEFCECKNCGAKIEYTPTKEIKGVNCEFPFRFVADWYDYQKDFINKLDVNEYISAPIYHDEADVFEVIINKKKVPFKSGTQISLYGDKIVFDEGMSDETKLRFDEISAVSVLGRNKANIYFLDKVYQLKGDKRFNALKYVHIYYRHKNITKGNECEQFLGL
ncbi:MAG: 1-acyl-sn-glycerol-3-phosphate acyltransferase [Clostridia bacterium]|nr:1-acyl-sn-glycerol-3-phosphate acyltransferase [Clostridia bacterium]